MAEVKNDQEEEWDVQRVAVAVQDNQDPLIRLNLFYQEFDSDHTSSVASDDASTMAEAGPLVAVLHVIDNAVVDGHDAAEGLVGDVVVLAVGGVGEEVVDGAVADDHDVQVVVALIVADGAAVVALMT